MTLQAKPVWFQGVQAEPARGEVTVTFTEVLDRTHSLTMAFHEAKALHDALARTFRENPPERLRQWEWPRVLG